MAKFSSKEDVQSTIDAGIKSGGDFLKLEEGNNYIIILSDEYEQGFQHWIKTTAKTFKRTCLADMEDKGWDPEGCPGCAIASDMYQMKKEALAEGDKDTADIYNKRGNGARSGYSALMQAVKGTAVQVRRKNKRTGKPEKKWVPDFDEFSVGSLRLTHPQISKLFSLIDDPDYPQIKSAEDLIGRILNFVKEKTSKDKKYAEVTKVIPSKKEFDVESLEIDEEDVPDISQEFAVDDDWEEIAELYRQELEEDTEEEYERQDLKKKKTKKSSSKKATPKKKKTKKKVVEEEEIEEEEEEEELEEEEVEEEDYEEEEEETEEEEESDDEDWTF